MSGMHLMSHAYSTTNTRKRKSKNKTKKLKSAEIEHEKFLEKFGVSDSQLKDKLYDKYGKRKHFGMIPNYSEHQATAALSNRVAGPAPAKQQLQYTGDEIAGIVTTHKSNLMPVRRDNKKAIVDAAQMRR